MIKTDKIYVLSDLHLGSDNFYRQNSYFKNIFRPEFPNSESADQAIIANINATVGEQETLLLLGDLARTDSHLEKLADINCKNMYAVLGNHDAHLSTRALNKHFKRCFGALYLKPYVFTHIPIHPSELRGTQINVHGHTHRKSIEDSRYINASVEPNNYTPFSIQIK